MGSLSDTTGKIKRDCIVALRVLAIEKKSMTLDEIRKGAIDEFDHPIVFVHLWRSVSHLINHDYVKPEQENGVHFILTEKGQKEVEEYEPDVSDI